MSIQSTFRIEVPASVFGTYQDMVNSGDLRLLRNSELRLALAEFVSEWEKYESSIAEGFNQWNQIQVPYMIANMDVVSLYLNSYQGSSFQGQVYPIDRDRIWNQEFQNVLGVAVINNIDQIDVGETIIERLDQLLNLLQKEVGESDVP